MRTSTGVCMCTRKKLLVARVQAHQLLQQPIPPKTFGIEEVSALLNVLSLHVVILHHTHTCIFLLS